MMQHFHIHYPQLWKMIRQSKSRATYTDFLTIECVQHGEFMHDTAKIDRLKDCYKKYDLKPEETILVDARIYNQSAAIESGAHPVRMRCEFTTDLPSELSWIPEVPKIDAVKDWLIKQQSAYS